MNRSGVLREERQLARALIDALASEMVLRPRLKRAVGSPASKAAD